MAVTAGRRAALTLYSAPNCCACHRTRLVALEKGLDVDICYVSPSAPVPQELLDVNPAASLPTLVDRDVVLYNDRVIIEYLDERYPHPMLLKADPVGRAKQRLALSRIESEWCALLPRFNRANREERDLARATLRQQLIDSTSVFAAKPFFLGDEFSLLDATLAPVLWRLPQYEIELPGEAQAVTDYAERLFSRPAFRASLSAIESEMRA